MTLTVGSLFAGIGGFDLGFERCGMRTVWQVEQNDFCRDVLARHFPDAQRFVDVREVGAHNLAPVDLICGGFPCQDISLAGAGAGIDGARSGLWSEFARIIGELGPRYVVVENVPAIRSRGLDRVLRDLAALGYDAEWDCVPASALGAPHQRDRFWLVAYPNADGRELIADRSLRDGWEVRAALEGSAQPRTEWPTRDDARAGARGGRGGAGDVPDAEGDGCRPGGPGRPAGAGQDGEALSSPGMADPEVERQRQRAGLREDGPGAQRGRRSGDGGGEGGVGDSDEINRSRGCPTGLKGQAGSASRHQEEGGRRPVESDLRRVPDGLPSALDGDLVAGQGMGSAVCSPRFAEVILRVLRGDGEAGSASPGRRPDEQLVREFGNALSQLPYERALGDGEAAVAAAWLLRCVRIACAEAGLVRDPSLSLAQAWQSVSGEAEGWLWAVLVGGRWAEEWPGVPRVAAGVGNRVDRLAALGNALVPQIAEWIGWRILDYEASAND